MAFGSPVEVSYLEHTVIFPCEPQTQSERVLRGALSFAGEAGPSLHLQAG